MKKTFALFDFDGTLIKGDSAVLFLLYAYQKKLLSFVQLLRCGIIALFFKLGFIPPETSNRVAFSFMNGWKLEETKKLGLQFCKDVLISRLRPQGVAEISKLNENGYAVLIITASASFYMQAFKQILNVSDVIATRYKADDCGCFTSIVDGSNCRGQEKVCRLREYLLSSNCKLDENSSFAYGDSASDYPMMQCCENRMGINPKKKLRKLLQKDSKASILFWKEPE